MRRRLIWAALALSLALNVFFIGGAVWIRMHVPHHPGGGPFAGVPPRERVEAVARDLSLDAAQRSAFDRFIRETRQETKQVREANQKLGDAAWEEMAKQQPDDDLLHRLFDEISANRREYQTGMTRSLQDFLGKLSPEQRRHFVELVRDRQDHHGPPLLRQLLQ
ncbi:MAG TPA: periplasmic heavy metal sensor [Stellaceae bacterium]